jgi:transcription antitermination protein NusB
MRLPDVNWSGDGASLKSILSLLIVTDLPEINPEDIVETEVLEHEAAGTERTVARRMALQVLYEVDSAHHAVGSVLASRLEEEPVSKRAARFAQQFVTGVLEHRDRLNVVIKHYAPEWPLDQMAVVDRNILRLAIYELLIEPSAPVRVTIDEAVALARLYGAEGSIRFVNGVLGTLTADEDRVRQLLAIGDKNVP